MKGRSINFSGERVRATLDGRMTQVRLVMKPQPEIIQNVAWWWNGMACWGLNGRPDLPVGGSPNVAIFCPLGQPGDLLWVRETWAPAHYSESSFGGEPTWFEWQEAIHGPLVEGAGGLSLHYRADGEAGNPAEFYPVSGKSEIPWRPSTHMPRWASRLTLEITGVKVERLQEISEEDARAEGISDGGCLNCGNPEPCGCDAPAPDARESFIFLWDSINGKRPGCSWADNPWVWAITFKRIES